MSVIAPSRWTASGGQICAALGLAICVWALLEWLRFRLRYDWHKIPGTPVWPIVGDLPSFLRFSKGDPKMHEYSYFWWRKLGCPKVFRREILGRRFLTVNDPTFVQHYVTGHHGLPKSPFYEKFEVLFGPTRPQNMFSRRTNDAKWKAVRRNVGAAFSTENMKKTFPKILKTGQQFIEELKKVPAGQAVNIRQLLSYFTFSVISSWWMGLETDVIQSRTHPFLEAQVYCEDEAVRDAMSPLRRMYKQWFPFTEMAKRSRQAFKRLYAIMDDLTDRVQRTAPPPEDDFSVASCLYRAKESLENDKFSEEEMKSETIAFFFGGTDTTAQQLSWALCCIACNKGVQTKLAAELDSAGLGGSNPRDLDFDDLRSLPYLNAVIKETFRLLPAASNGSSRYLLEDTTIMGYRIPKNTIVVGQIFAMNRLDDVYKDPDKFDPDRWLGNEQPNQQHDKNGRRILWTFSNGPRDCVGRRLATVEIQTVLAMILGRFSVELDERMGGWEGAMAKKFDHIVTCCKGGMWVKLYPRY